ncbi:conserved hypothetical protein [Neorickettsia risticii str. Illinois]|uniref:Uncharacterized protein n=1 Tax=Neorickettsia risticii (strain Illinois) TaxID=434131 RepID=C6V564_NEORI|nr:conserved hypothetical protein [Neorickettsia risticii str. Illinois]
MLLLQLVNAAYPCASSSVCVTLVCGLILVIGISLTQTFSKKNTECIIPTCRTKANVSLHFTKNLFSWRPC